MKVSVVGIFNSFYLMPIYGTAPKVAETAYITDPLQMVTLGHLPSESARFLATVFAAYILFGYSMYLILKEFEWVTKYRHRYISKFKPENYTVFVSNIPEEYQSSAALLDYFRGCFAYESVLDAHVTLTVPNLEKKVAQREAVVNNLEHAINVLEVTGTKPTHRNILKGGVVEESIPVYSEELKTLNQEISEEITRIEIATNPKSYQNDLETAQRKSDVYMQLHPSLRNLQNDDVMEGHNQEMPMEEDSEKKSSFFGGIASKGTSALSGAVSGAVSGVGNFVMGEEEGTPRTGGFVTFSNLKTTQAALQMIHHATPFCMMASTAPRPEEVYWGNVGKSNKALQIGSLMSGGLTALLCVFWTIPVAFVGTLTEADSLKQTLPFLEKMIDEQPWFEQFLAQLSPVLLMVLVEILPAILLEFSKFEGHINEATLNASMFRKLASFMVIQTFFVSAISGSIAAELEKMLEDPSAIIDLLANSLPNQSAYFMQFLMVKTFLGMGIELLRISSVVMAFIRSKVGPNLTEKERNTTWLGLRPLADPLDFRHAEMLAEMILYFMVTFVYSVMAPMTAFVLFMNFLILSFSYRHQIIYIYPIHPDSGGGMMIRFFGFMTAAMLIAQITLVGVFALKKAAIATPLFIPLIVTTVLFNRYIGQQHFYVTQYLPSKEAMAKDLSNQSNRDQLEGFRTAFVQPSLQEKILQPENLGTDREIQMERLNYYTPPGSEAEPIDDLLSPSIVEPTVSVAPEVKLSASKDQKEEKKGLGGLSEI
eukprot:CAMPEP_0118686614 /NCGR_PEP_ID=MMETSP0800-20121206/7914_1 /TAXON_ID=210618 ORGANISM="Striatella unipunctata, Strain CCMP2910" /NCGR_SAMPLE_ID=MMETSP0800 /ASSEMBLY_ACC=CAM_ASM_000638 /LENGTH=765 /DNA_ID=CAMNT_0006583685 /DNA_START=169 /DNA_END=2466 /DNA_ORIENTATION=-